MIDLSLDQLALYAELKRRTASSPLATTLAGLLHPIVGDAREFLEFVRQSCPSFTRHNVQHSLTIAYRIGRILSPDAIHALSSAEIFGFLLAALFHDAGMATFDGARAGQARADHPRRSGVLLSSYLSDRIGVLSEYTQRLAACTAFVMECHGLTWDAMTARREFNVPNSVLDEPFRCSLLAVLLRVGDLLDLDSDRSCDALRRHGAIFFKDPISRTHHDRHKRVTEFAYDDRKLHIHVEPRTREEHQIWHEWLDYLKQDILHANTYLFIDSLSAFRLPVPSLEVVPAAGAGYDLWPLRFELDESGRLWDVISQSIYTGHFDFVRELVQNAIDAVLAVVFSDANSHVPTPSPRTWSLATYQPAITVRYSETHGILRISDNGIGMTREDLSRFLFRVAQTGFDTAVAPRAFRFPSIATFGIGFISVLVRAARVQITSRRRLNSGSHDDDARRVILTAGSREALVERVDDAEFGTTVEVLLRERYLRSDLVDWLQSQFRYPSAPITYIDLDDIDDFGNAAGANHTATPRKRVRKANVLRKPRAEAPTFSIPVARLPNLPEQPLIASLGPRVRFLRSGPARRHKTPYVMWIPVSVDDFELGIEWRSVHSFVALGGKIRRSVTVPAPMRVFDPFDGRNVEEFDADSSLSAADVSSIRTTRSGLVYRFGTHDFARIGLQHYLDQRALDERAVRSPLETYSTGLGSFADYFVLDDIAYQDGVPLPIKAWWVAPIGACSATMNFTASARLRLNVTRHSIDENSTVLREWCNSVVTRIQESVVRAILPAFELADWDFRRHTLLPANGGRTPNLLLHSELNLRRVLQNAWKPPA
jgi:hypothetical protein